MNIYQHKKPEIRLLYIGLGLLLANIWIYIQWTSIPQQGGRRNNLDIQNHVKTNQPSNRRKIRIQQQKITIYKTNTSTEKIMKKPMKIMKTSTK
jgi:hypothetical protein